MKNKKWIIMIVVIMIVLIFPIRYVLKDGGSVKYQSILYEVTSYHQINNNYLSGYLTGLEIKILGINVYKKITAPENYLKIVKINDELYYEVKEEQQNYNNCSSTMMDGEINSHVNFDEIPKNNNEANFNGDYPYQNVSKNVIKICIDNNTLFFKRKTENVENIEEKDSIDTEYNIHDKGNIDIDSDFVYNLYYKVNPSNDISILKGMYETDKFSNDYILTTGIENLVRKNHLRLTEFLDVEEIEKEIHQIFGTNVTVNHHKIYMFSSDEFKNGTCGYTYLPNAKKYQLIHGCGGNANEFMLRKLVSAEKEGDQILLKEKSIYYLDDWNDYVSKIYVYNNYNREKLLDYIEKESTTPSNFSLEDYINEASTYVYVFKKEKENWILKSIQKE